MFTFLIIPDEGDAIGSLLPYHAPEAARSYGEIIARRVMTCDQEVLETFRPELAALALSRPKRLELVVIDQETKSAHYPPTMIEKA